MSQHLCKQADFYCTRWGSAELPFSAFLDRVTQYGFDGVEMAMPPDQGEWEAMRAAIAERGLKLICQHWATVETDFESSYVDYTAGLEALCSLGPVRINAQTGKDFYTNGQNLALLQAAHEIGEHHGVEIVHETHRGRFSYAAHVTRAYLQRLPELCLCLDISHWCAVAESMLDNQADSVELALRRTRHIHARVGCTQSPQVPDPRAPEWEPELIRHLRWWAEVVRSNARNGVRTSITSEFGPAPYMTQLPFSRQPICDQWEANVFIMQRVKAHLATPD